MENTAALLTGGTRRELLEDCMDAELVQYALGLVLLHLESLKNRLYDNTICGLLFSLIFHASIKVLCVWFENWRCHISMVEHSNVEYALVFFPLTPN